MTVWRLAGVAGSRAAWLRFVWPVMALWLVACASGPQFIWWKTQFSRDAFARDAYDCRQLAKSAASTMPIPTYADVIRKTGRQRALYAMCLETRGYRQVEGEDGQPLEPFIPPGKGFDVRDRRPNQETKTPA